MLLKFIFIQCLKKYFIHIEDFQGKYGLWSYSMSFSVAGFTEQSLFRIECKLSKVVIVIALVHHFTCKPRSFRIVF